MSIVPQNAPLQKTPAEQLATPFAWCPSDQPGEPAGPREGAADALEESRDPECPHVPGERKAEARGGHQHQADEDGAFGPEPRGCESSWNRAEQRSRRVGRDEDAGAGLREVVLVREVGE